MIDPYKAEILEAQKAFRAARNTVNELKNRQRAERVALMDAACIDCGLPGRLCLIPEQIKTFKRLWGEEGVYSLLWRYYSSLLSPKYSPATGEYVFYAGHRPIKPYWRVTTR